MISATSNCCRIDAVKSSANQLKAKLTQHSDDNAADPTLRSASQELQTLDSLLKSGDANQAELALYAVKSSIDRLDYSAVASKGSQIRAQYGSLSIRA